MQVFTNRNLAKIINVSLLMVLFIIITACSSDGHNSPGAITLDNGAGESIFHTPAAISLVDLPPGTLHAYLKVNDRDFIEMSVTNDQAALQIPNLTTGQNTFTIKWEYNSNDFGIVLLAEGTKSIELVTGENVLDFSDNDYNTASLDSDNDGLSNVEELLANTNPNDSTCIFDVSLFDNCTFDS